VIYCCYQFFDVFDSLAEFFYANEAEFTCSNTRKMLKTDMKVDVVDSTV